MKIDVTVFWFANYLPGMLHWDISYGRMKDPTWQVALKPHSPHVVTRVLCIKLGFLLKILNSENSLSARVFRSLAASDVEGLQLIRQCRFLESSLNTNFTTRILSSHQEISFSALKKEIFEVDFSLLLSEASNHASQRYVQAVAASSISSWPKVWDSALEKGAFGTSCSLALLRLLSLHTYSDNKCPVPNCSYVVGEDSLCSHFLADHTTLSITAEQCVDILENCSEEIYSHGKALNQIFRDIWNWLVLNVFLFLTSPM